jgi:hypothetical protein
MITRFFYALLFIVMMILPSVGLPGFSTDALADSAKAKETEEVKGKIVDINVSANTIRLEPGVFSLEKDLQVTPQTKIIVDGKPGNLGQLRKGDKVKVHYAEGKGEFRTAEYIEVIS